MASLVFSIVRPHFLHRLKSFLNHSCPLSHMSQNKRHKMDLGATCSSTSVNTRELSKSVVDIEAEIVEGSETAQFSVKKREALIFNESEVDFKEAVKWTGFVDKTMLIEELLQQPSRVIIFVPKRFGKSLNMNMVKCFFEIEKGRDVSHEPHDLKEIEELKNYRAFCRYGLSPPCKILKETNLVKRHFGRHPVVHLDLKDIKPKSIEHVEEKLKNLIHKAYVKCSYLKDSNDLGNSPTQTKIAKRNCEDWLNKDKYQEENVEEGLQNLIEYLHNHHKRKVYLLVDEFDAPAVNALLARKSGDEVKNISNEVISLLGAILKGNECNDYILGSLVTGVSYLGSIGISQHLNNVPFFKWLLDDQGRFLEYYGLSDEELTTLVENVFPGQKEKRICIRQEVVELYNGYYFKNEAVYCLWSVLHYIRLRSKMDASKMGKSFWAASSIISSLGKVLRNSHVLKVMIDVMGGGTTSFIPYQKVDAENIAELLNGQTTDEDIIFSFFLEQGYLSLVTDPSSKCKSEDVCVKIPNVEVMVAFREMLRNFCVYVCGLSNEVMLECAQIFRNFNADECIDDEEFTDMLREFHGHLKTLFFQFKTLEGVNERSIQAAMYTTMLQAGFKECCMEKTVSVKTKDKRKSGKIDLWMRDNIAVIWEFNYNWNEEGDCNSTKDSSRQALLEILYGSKDKKVPYVQILSECNVKNYLLIGFSMGSECKPFMSCLRNSENPDLCIVFPED